MGKRIEIKKEKLIKLYVEQNKTTYDIAVICKCSRKVISNLLKKYRIPCMNYKIKFSDNPVETCSFMNRVSGLKCLDANTPSSSFKKKMMV